MHLLRSLTCGWFIFLVFTDASAQKPVDQSELSLERIYGSNDFQETHAGPWQWLESRESYSTQEPSTMVKGGHDLVLYDAPTSRREVLIRAEQLIPSESKSPLHM